MSSDWVVVGAGGHGREVAAVVQALGGNLLGFLDDNPAKTGTQVGGLTVLGGLDWLEQANAPLCVAVGIGASVARRATVLRLKAMVRKLSFPPLIHPDARLGIRLEVGEGTLVQSGCILACDVKVGDFVVLNLGVSLSHDSVVGDFATLAPGARMAGAVHVGAMAEVGMGTLVIQGRTLGEACFTGAGAVIIRDVEPNVTVVGVPGRILNYSC